MKHVTMLAGLGLVLVAALLMAPGVPVPARAAGATATTEWSHYLFELPSITRKWGDVIGSVSTPLMSAKSDLMAKRTWPESGINTGGSAAFSFSVTGIVVLNPKPERSYSWKADSRLKPTSFTAKVELGELGYASGRAEGRVSMQMYGDLKWKCQREVAARDFKGGKWQIAWLPSYSLPPIGSRIGYCKGTHASTVLGESKNNGADHHAQVRFMSRIEGDVLAFIQRGLDVRWAKSRLDLDATAIVNLWGYTQLPAKDDVTPPPYLGGYLNIGMTTKTVTMCDHEYEELNAAGEPVAPTPPEPAGDKHAPGDFEAPDW